MNRSEPNGGSWAVNLLSAFNAGASRPVGTVAASPAKCVASYNGSFNVLAASCT